MAYENVLQAVCDFFSAHGSTFILHEFSYKSGSYQFAAVVVVLGWFPVESLSSSVMFYFPLPDSVCVPAPFFFRVHLSFIRSLAHVYLSVTLVAPLFGPGVLFSFLILFLAFWVLNFGYQHFKVLFFFFCSFTCLSLPVWHLGPFRCKKKINNKSWIYISWADLSLSNLRTFKTLSRLLTYRQHILSFIC